MSEAINKIKGMGASEIEMDIDDRGIIAISFLIKDVRIQAQADIDNEGVYAIQLPSLDDLSKLLTNQKEAIKS